MKLETSEAAMDRLKAETNASIWNAIRYLDSATGYREHLVCDTPQLSSQAKDLVLLDDRHSRRPLWIAMLICLPVCVVLLLVLAGLVGIL